MLTNVKNILTHVTHTAHVKIWPTQPTQPTQPTDRRNTRTHVTHVTTQPTRLSRTNKDQYDITYFCHISKNLWKINKNQAKFIGTFKNVITPRLVVYNQMHITSLLRLQIVENCFGQMSYKMYLRAVINTIYSLFVTNITPFLKEWATKRSNKLHIHQNTGLFLGQLEH